MKPVRPSSSSPRPPTLQISSSKIRPDIEREVGSLEGIDRGRDPNCGAGGAAARTRPSPAAQGPRASPAFRR